MSFVQAEFLLFFAVVWALYWSPLGRRGQNAVLVLASAVFYGWVHPAWVVLLYSSAGVDFAMGQLMVRSPRFKRVWLGLSLLTNLGLLFWFKYFDFFLANVVTALTALGIPAHAGTLGLLLPAGLSFYTFQTMSYTLDIYRGELKPRTSLLDYLAFVSFFPQLVAGPIERAARLLPQLEVARRFRWSNLRDGFGLALWGAFKKVAIADTLAPYVDKAFLLDDPSGPVVWAATTGFMLQLYADFSGYTDLARGTARMLGIDLVRNFDEPYLAATTQEFWQRWHISLSTWIRDYLLTPLLGNAAEIGPARFVFAVTVTMVVMGLWHGAGWNFVLFGLFQAAAIGGYALAQRHLPERMRTLRHGRTLAAAFHLLVVGELGALLFREHSVARIVQHLSKSPFTADADEWRVAVALLAIAAVLNVPLVLEHVARRKVLPALEESEWLLPVQTTVWSLYVVGIAVAYRETGADFIYFQF